MRFLPLLGVICIVLGGCIAVQHAMHEPVEHAFQQRDYQRSVEEEFTHRISGMLDRVVGPGNHETAVTITVSWDHVASEQIEISAQSAAPVSEKTYAESSGNAGNANIEETLTNYSYPWAKITSENLPGSIQRVSAAILINENAPNVPAQSMEFVEKITNTVSIALGQSYPGDERVRVTVQLLPFAD